MVEKKSKTVTIVKLPEGEINAEDLNFKTIKEDFNIYQLEDGTRIKIKVVVAKISRGIDPKTGGIYYLPSGEPLYNVRHQPIIVTEVPKKLQKTKESLEEKKGG